MSKAKIEKDTTTHGTEIKALELTPELDKKLVVGQKVVHGGGISDDGKTLVLYTRLLGITPYGIPSIGIEARVVLRNTEYEVKNLYGGLPLRMRVKVGLKPEFELAFFGDAIFTMGILSLKTVFSILPKIIPFNESSILDKVPYDDKEIPSFVMSCVIRSHPIRGRRYIFGLYSPLDATPGVAERIIGAFYSSALLHQVLSKTDEAINDEEKRVGELLKKEDGDVLVPEITTPRVVFTSESLNIYEDEVEELTSLLDSMIKSPIIQNK